MDRWAEFNISGWVGSVGGDIGGGNKITFGLEPAE